MSVIPKEYFGLHLIYGLSAIFVHNYFTNVNSNAISKKIIMFNEIIKKMQKTHEIEAIVLGCTELPLLLNNDNCVLPCLDSVVIHIEELIELAQNVAENTEAII